MQLRRKKSNVLINGRKVYTLSIKKTFFFIISEIYRRALLVSYDTSVDICGKTQGTRKLGSAEPIH
jgi:hypothetical protein